MKWRIKFEITYRIWDPEQKEITVEAPDIVAALARFIRNTQRKLEKAKEVIRVDVYEVSWIQEENDGKHDQ